MQVHSALFALVQILPGLSLSLARDILQSSHLHTTFEALLTSSHLSHGQRGKLFITETH